MTAVAARSSNELAQDRTDLALDRTLMAADRTLMAWVRTALSMISFGFTIYKFLETMRTDSSALPPEGPRRLGLTLIVLGIVSLLLASMQYVAHLRRLGRPRGDALRHLTLWVAGCVGFIGLFALLNLAFRIGPF
jgi:inner membrane protein YidH